MQPSSPSAPNAVDPAAVADLIEQVKKLAKEYRKRTGRPLGVTGEVAEYEACRLLGLCLAPVRQEGYDAIRQTPDGMRRVQVKGRVLFAGAKPGQRLSKISLKHEWESTIVVVLDDDLEPTIIYEAERAAIAAARLEVAEREGSARPVQVQVDRDSRLEAILTECGRRTMKPPP